MKLLSISCLSLFVSLSTSINLLNGGNTRVGVIPNTVVIDGSRLVENKQRIRAGHTSYITALNNLIAQADSWLGKGPWTVTNKTQAPPNGKMHDYASQAPY